MSLHCLTQTLSWGVYYWLGVLQQPKADKCLTRRGSSYWLNVWLTRRHPKLPPPPHHLCWKWSRRRHGGGDSFRSQLSFFLAAFLKAKSKELEVNLHAEKKKNSFVSSLGKNEIPASVKRLKSGQTWNVKLLIHVPLKKKKRKSIYGQEAKIGNEDCWYEYKWVIWCSLTASGLPPKSWQTGRLAFEDACPSLSPLIIHNVTAAELFVTNDFFTGSFKGTLPFFSQLIGPNSILKAIIKLANAPVWSKAACPRNLEFHNF